MTGGDRGVVGGLVSIQGVRFAFGGLLHWTLRALVGLR